MQMLKILLGWLHVLGMVGAFGSLLVVQWGLPRDVRDSAAGARVGPRLISWMLGVGFLAGVGLFLLRLLPQLKADVPLSAEFIGVVAVKFVLLLVAGAMVGISSAKLRAGLVRTASRLRVFAVVALALAALLGLRIGT